MTAIFQGSLVLATDPPPAGDGVNRQEGPTEIGSSTDFALYLPLDSAPSYDSIESTVYETVTVTRVIMGYLPDWDTGAWGHYHAVLEVALGNVDTWYEVAHVSSSQTLTTSYTEPGPWYGADVFVTEVDLSYTNYCYFQMYSWTNDAGNNATYSNPFGMKFGAPGPTGWIDDPTIDYDTAFDVVAFDTTYIP